MELGKEVEIECNFGVLDGRWYRGKLFGESVFYSEEAERDKLGHNGTGVSNTWGCWFINESLEGPSWRRISCSSGRTIFVDSRNGNDCTGDGSKERPYRTSAHALNTGRPGDTIVVSSLAADWSIEALRAVKTEEEARRWVGARVRTSDNKERRLLRFGSSSPDDSLPWMSIEGVWLGHRSKNAPYDIVAVVSPPPAAPQPGEIFPGGFRIGDRVDYNGDKGTVCTMAEAAKEWEGSGGWDPVPTSVPVRLDDKFGIHRYFAPPADALKLINGSPDVLKVGDQVRMNVWGREHWGRQCNPGEFGVVEEIGPCTGDWQDDRKNMIPDFVTTLKADVRWHSGVTNSYPLCALCKFT